MKQIARFFAGPGMVAAGIYHFVNPHFYLRIVPDALPAPEALVYVSGVGEILGALGTMHPRTKRPAGWFLITVLVAVYPANIYMATSAEKFPEIPQWALLIRLPLQFVFIYWVWLATLKKEPGSTSDIGAVHKST